MELAGNKLLRLISVLLLIGGLALGLRLKPVFPTLTNAEPESTLQSLPPVMLWAWERPERLDFLDTTNVGVAFLAKTIQLHNDDITVRPRLQPLLLANGTKVVAVVRIESDRHDNPALSEEQLDRMTSEIVQTSQLPDVLAIQIDFDAKVSERDFYRRLLLQVRKRLPQTMPLSITALASWCDGDNWLTGLPIDEAVPMLFRMGVDSRQFRSRLRLGEDTFAIPCDNAAGVSTDEPITAPRRKRLYIFSPKPWTSDSVKSALEAYAK